MTNLQQQMGTPGHLSYLARSQVLKLFLLEQICNKQPLFLLILLIQKSQSTAENVTNAPPTQ